MKVQVVGTVSEVLGSGLPFEDLVKKRSFTRWYRKNKRTVNTIASTAVFTFAPQVAFAQGTFFSGHGVILLHMLIIGFLTLCVTTFLKFTGRGDLAPLVMFVGGAVILYECMELFNDIYKGVEAFFNM